MAIREIITANCENGQLSKSKIARQWDDQGTLIQFAGYPEPETDEELIFRLIVWMWASEDTDPVELPPIELDADQWLISNYYTQLPQMLRFQLCITNEAGTYEKHSPIFSGVVDKSLSHDGEEAEIDVIPLFDPYKKYVDELVVDAGARVVDTELNETSTNLVQNKAVAKAVADVNGRLDGLGDGVPTEVRQAILTLFQSAAYAETGLTDEVAVIESWAATITAITLNKSSVNISGASTNQLVATTTPAGGTVTWASSDTSVATVSSSGLVTGVGNGSCTITASCGGKKATCTATVTGFASLTGITANYTQSGTVYNTDTLDSLKSDLVVTANYSDSTTVTLSDSDYTLSGTLEVGTSTIVVSYADKTASFNVTVTAPSQFAVEYQGNFTTSTASSTRVTLITNDITLPYGKTLTISAENGYVVFPLEEWAVGNNTSLIRTAKTTNQIYVYGVNDATSYVYTTNDKVVGATSAKITLDLSNWGTTRTATVSNSSITSLTFSGIGFFVEKGTPSSHGGSDITIEEAKAAVSVTIS
jgi:hypothetical protein